MSNQTERQNPKSLNIDTLPTLEMLRLINAEDAAAVKAVNEVLPLIAQAVEVIAERLDHGGRLLYIGAGTSGRLAVLDAAECLPTYGIAPEMVQAIIAGGHTALINSVEGAEDDRAAGKRDLQARHLRTGDVVVGIAASGYTPYVLGGLEYANEIGAYTVGIANNADTPVLESAKLAIALLTGPEVITGSTRMKAGTSQKITLNTISTAVMIKLGKVYGNLMVEVQAKNVKLRQRAQRIVSQIAEVDQQTAAVLLEQTDYDVKTAIVIAKLDVDAAEARHRLQAAKGRLRAVIG